MKIYLPDHIHQISNYKPGKPTAQWFDGEQESKTAVLCSNENNFGPSPLAVQAIQENLDKIYLYPDPTGSILKSAISSYYKIPENQILLGNGSDGILYSLFKAFFDPGDHLLTSHGTFVSLAAMAKMNRVEYRTIPMTKQYGFDLEAILDAIDSKTRVIYLCNPNNPTGAMIPKDDLLHFIRQVPEDRLIIVDEAYYEFASDLSEDYPDSTRLHFPNVLTLRTFSKAYGLAGLRLGFAIAQPELIDVLHKVKLTFNPNMLAQVAGVAALQDQKFLEKTLSNNKTELGKMYSLFEKLGIPYVPSYGNFVMIDLGTESLVEWMYERLRSNKVLIRRLASFGLPHCARISIGLPEENEWFFTCFQEAVQHQNLNHT